MVAWPKRSYCLSPSFNCASIDALIKVLSLVQDQDMVRQRFGGVGKAPRKTGVYTLFG